MPLSIAFLFLAWVSSAERYWVTLAKRRSNLEKRDSMPQDFVNRIRPIRVANARLLRRGQASQLSLEFEVLAGRKGPRKATQMTLVKLPGQDVA
jgi:hypothetical protein